MPSLVGKDDNTVEISAKSAPKESVALESVPPKPVEWVENDVTDSLAYFYSVMVSICGFLGFILPIIGLGFLVVVRVDFDFWEVFPLAILTLGLPLGITFAFFGFRSARSRVARTVGIGDEGIVVVGGNGLEFWIPFDSVIEIDALRSGREDDSLIGFKADKLGGRDSILVSKEITARISVGLENLGYKVTPQGLVCKPTQGESGKT